MNRELIKIALEKLAVPAMPSTGWQTQYTAVPRQSTTTPQQATTTPRRSTTAPRQSTTAPQQATAAPRTKRTIVPGREYFFPQGSDKIMWRTAKPSTPTYGEMKPTRDDMISYMRSGATSDYNRSIPPRKMPRTPVKPLVRGNIRTFNR